MRIDKGPVKSYNPKRNVDFFKKRLKSFGDIKIIPIFAIPNQEKHSQDKENNIADVAQLARARDL